MKTIPIEQFGKDHWSTFGYIETCCVDSNGVPNRDKMRTNKRRHPDLLGARVAMASFPWDARNGTRLAGFFEAKENKARLQISQHDDWDCADDLESAGLIEIHGTGIQPFYKMTAKGTRIASLLRTTQIEWRPLRWIQMSSTGARRRRMSEIYEILTGWEYFQRVHTPKELMALRVFGLFMCGPTVCNSKRQAKTEIEKAMQEVAKHIRRDCVRCRIPLWPAVIPTQQERQSSQGVCIPLERTSIRPSFVIR